MRGTGVFNFGVRFVRYENRWDIRELDDVESKVLERESGLDQGFEKSKPCSEAEDSGSPIKNIETIHTTRDVIDIPSEVEGRFGFMEGRLRIRFSGVCGGVQYSDAEDSKESPLTRLLPLKAFFMLGILIEEVREPRFGLATG